MPKYERQATQFCEAIKALAASEDSLNNLESYLSYHFADWMRKYASDPDGIASELEQFATIH